MMRHRAQKARELVQEAMKCSQDTCELEVVKSNSEWTLCLKPTTPGGLRELYRLATTGMICDNRVVQAAFQMTEGLHLEEIVGLEGKPTIARFMTSPGVFGDVYGDAVTGTLQAKLRYVGSPRSFGPIQSRDLRLVERALCSSYAWTRRQILAVGHELPFNTVEKAVLKWTAVGKTSEEIATILGMSKRSVDDYQVGLATKLGATNRAQTVVSAIELGLIGA